MFKKPKNTGKIFSVFFGIGIFSVFPSVLPTEDFWWLFGIVRYRYFFGISVGITDRTTWPISKRK
jgi:hypothetical protein